jgi:hypothetical protein
VKQWNKKMSAGLLAISTPHKVKIEGENKENKKHYTILSSLTGSGQRDNLIT